MPQRALIIVFAFATAGLLSASTAMAQRPLGWLSASISIIQGQVLDFFGEPIGDASVTAESPRTNRRSTRVVEGRTDDSGRFSFNGLSRGRWVVTVQKQGYEPIQTFVPILRAGREKILSLTMDIDLLNPPVPSTGLLAGVRADDLQAELDAAHSLFDQGEYDSAISAYKAILTQVPNFTSLNLQIGHAYREKRNYDLARAAYQKVPSDTLAWAEAAPALTELNTLAPSR